MIPVRPRDPSQRFTTNTDMSSISKDVNYDKLITCKDRAEAFIAYLIRIGKDPQVQVQFDFDPVRPLLTQAGVSLPARSE